MYILYIYILHIIELANNTFLGYFLMIKMGEIRPSYISQGELKKARNFNGYNCTRLSQHDFSNGYF